MKDLLGSLVETIVTFVFLGVLLAIVIGIGSAFLSGNYPLAFLIAFVSMWGIIYGCRNF